MSENTYKTKQKSIILKLLQDNSENSFTIDEIVALLKESGESVGRTTVYRFVERLFESGEVRRFYEGRKSGATYQYVEKDNNCQDHMHLKCTECGKLIHLGCDFMNGVCTHIEEHHKFFVNNSKTTILGVCEACRKNGENYEADRL